MKFNQKTRSRLQWLAFFTCVLAVITVFILSSQTAKQSFQLSEKVTQIGIHIIHALSPNETTEQLTTLTQPELDQLNNRVRDYAHAGLYGGVAVVIFSFLNLVLPQASTHARNLSRPARYLFLFILTLALCFSISLLDEWHQASVDGRGSQWLDIRNDMIGTTIGIILTALFNQLMRPLVILFFKNHKKRQDFL